MRRKETVRGLFEPVYYCKLGTKPALVNIHGSDAGKIAVGEKIRLREHRRSPWTVAEVQEVHPGGYFKAEELFSLERGKTSFRD